MENRRVMPGIFKGYPASLKQKDKEERDHTDPMYKPEKAEAHREKVDAQRKAAKEPKLERSYTIDEMTVATLLKGHPEAQEILDEFLKSKKKNESGEEFQDGSEDTIGGEGHEANLRGVDHKTGGGGNPGTTTKNASLEDGDLEKSDDDEDDDEDDAEKSNNFTDNEPEEFEDGLPGADGEDDSGDGPEGGDIVVSKKSIDDECLDFLIKTMGADRVEDVIKTVIGGSSVDPAKRRMLAQMPGAYKDKKEVEEGNPLTNRKVNPNALAALKNRLGTGGAEKSSVSNVEVTKQYPSTSPKTHPEAYGFGGASKSEESDLEKGEGGQKEERAEWAKDKEEEEKEHRKDKDMSEKSWSMDFSKSILENMGLEKGSPSVSKKVAGGKATQISYSSKPETRFKHPKQKTGETRYEHNVKEGTVTKKEATGEKGKFKEGKPIDVSDEKKLKNASEGGFDLHKSLDAILEKKTSR